MRPDWISLSRYDTHFQIGADLELRYFFCYKKITVTFEGNCLAESIKPISKSLLFPSACLRDAVSVKLYQASNWFYWQISFYFKLGKSNTYQIKSWVKETFLTSVTDYLDALALQNQSGRNWIWINVKTHLIKIAFLDYFHLSKK